jgi:hypothetical protein
VIKGSLVDPNVSTLIAKAKLMMSPAELADYENKATAPKNTYMLNYIIKNLKADYESINSEYVPDSLAPEPTTPRT